MRNDVIWSRKGRQVMIAHLYCSSQEAEAQGSLGVQGQLGLQMEFQDSQGFIIERPCLKKKIKNPNQTKKMKYIAIESLDLGIGSGRKWEEAKTFKLGTLHIVGPHTEIKGAGERRFERWHACFQTGWYWNAQKTCSWRCLSTDEHFFPSCSCSSGEATDESCTQTSIFRIVQVPRDNVRQKQKRDWEKGDQQEWGEDWCGRMSSQNACILWYPSIMYNEYIPAGERKLGGRSG